jgi:hypothetical protein
MANDGVPAVNPNPPAQELAALWEGDLSLRALAREQGCLTRWADKRVIGVASTGAMAINIKSLQLLAQWWCPQSPLPLSIPINTVRNEALCWDSFCNSCILHFKSDSLIDFIPDRAESNKRWSLDGHFSNQCCEIQKTDLKTRTCIFAYFRSPRLYHSSE